MRFTEKEVAEILAERSPDIPRIAEYMTVSLTIDRTGSPIGPQETEYVVRIVEDFDKLPRAA